MTYDQNTKQRVLLKLSQATKVVERELAELSIADAESGRDRELGFSGESELRDWLNHAARELCRLEGELGIW